MSDLKLQLKDAQKQAMRDKNKPRLPAFAPCYQSLNASK